MLTLGNGQLYYETIGSGEPIVFVHGFTLDHDMWQPQVEFFSKTHKVITYDARGFGKSSLPTDAYNHVVDLLALLNHLHIEKAHLVGLSMGGRIAINFTLTHPDIVKSLTLMDAALDGYPNEVDWDVHAGEQGIKKAKENWLNHEIFTPARNQPQTATTLRQIISTYSGWHWLHSDPQHPASTGALDRLHKIAVPTLVIVGEDDLNYFHNIATVIALKVPNSQKIIVSNAGHMVNMEAPDVVNATVNDFITNI